MKRKKTVGFLLLLLGSCLLFWKEGRAEAAFSGAKTAFTEETEDGKEEKPEKIQEVKLLRSPEETTEQYQYNIGSTSKMFGAVTVLQLAEQGKLELDKPVTEYLPEFTMADERYKDITVRMLLNHTAGFKGTLYSNSILFEDSDQIVHDTLLSHLKTQTLKSNPGEFAVYSNDGFSLAEILVEKVSQMDYSSYLKKYVFEPLDMDSSSTPMTNQEISVPHARNYIRKTIELPWECANIIASGGIYSTTEDLCRFSRIFFEDTKVLGRDMVQQISGEEYQSAGYLRLSGDSIMNFGLGADSVNLYPFNWYGIQAVSKGGDVMYQHAGFTILPEEKMSAAVLSSGGSTFNQLVTQAVLEAALEAKGRIEKKEIQIEEEIDQTAAEEIPEEILKLAGIYAGNELYEISFPDSELMRIEQKEAETQLVQEYHYSAGGYFTAPKGQYIDGNGLNQAQEEKNGISRLTFQKEEDGEIYLTYQTYMEYRGLDVSALTGVFAHRLTEKRLSPSVKAAWKEREGKGYYLSNEKYTSTNWARESYVRFEMSSQIEGYVKPSAYISAAEIMEEDFAQDASKWRDISNLSFQKEKGAEYAFAEDSGFVFVREEALEPLTERELFYEMQEEGKAKWYQITKEAAGTQVSFQIEGNGAIYVYDKYHALAFTTMMLNQGKTTVLPENGSVVLIGEAGCKFRME